MPPEDLPWQDPIPALDHELVDAAAIDGLKKAVLDSGLSVPELVATVWASASTFRISDKRGGTNGARLRPKPMKDWEVNMPGQLGKVLPGLEAIKKDFDERQGGSKKISMADLIVLAGCAAVEKAASDGAERLLHDFVAAWDKVMMLDRYDVAD